MEKEVIVKVKQNDEEAIKYMIEEYRNLIYSIISHFNLRCNDYTINRDDLYQEGVIALYEASKTYDLNGQASFTTYAYVVIRRRLMRVIANYFKIYSNEGVSMENVNMTTINKNSIKQSNFDNPSLVIERDHQKERYIKFIKSLNEEERKIFIYRKKKVSYRKIAELLNITPKHVDYIVSKIKKKYKAQPL